MKSPVLNIVICIDDAHPEKGWGMPDDECVSYLHKLNKDFGCKFIQFIPSNYHGKYPLSEHKDWVKYWSDLDWIEIAAHGHYHDCRNGGPGECEMVEHDYDSANDRIELCVNEWSKADKIPSGWRMPGWLATQESFDVVCELFNYVAIHETHNNNIKLDKNLIRIFRGADAINCDPHTLKIWNGDTIMFQSHIAGLTNDNNWNLENYTKFRNTLQLLKANYELNFTTLEELL